ncbi:UPF0481 protein At3g47200 [Silene latifolia]|uniref:UPF0481 protein At3g47200 n=1 Tax=Silene latifolia TaxID=37657 RepID=UPI003D77412A
MTTNHNRNHDHDHDHDHQATDVITLDVDRLDTIHKKMTTDPKILSKSVGRGTCSIFKVPKTFTEVNGKLYQPQIISIGPFHHGQPNFQMMEEHKYQYLGQLLTRTKLTLLALFDAVARYEAEIRECYSEIIQLEAQELLEMMVVDGCFILELFRKVAKVVPFEIDDPIASMSWIFPALLRDLHRFENQIPYFVLQILFDLTYEDGDHDDHDNGGNDVGFKYNLATLSLDFFNYILQRPNEVIWSYKDLKPKHLLDLLRSSFITPELVPKTRSKTSPTPSQIILPVSKLRRAGIELHPGQAQTFLAIKFNHGVIEMPTVTFDDFMTSLIANFVAFEQCHKNCSTYFTTYTTFVDSLVNTAKDVEHLCDHNIIENYFGTEAEIATFVNNLGKEVAFDIDQCYLAKLFDDVNTYYQNSWHVHWASFKYTYFNTPWSFISALAAAFLLVLTVMQAVYAILPYYEKK